jgi:hypothetical protein
MPEEFCPRCSAVRMGALRFCGSCAFDFESTRPNGAVAGDPLPELIPPVTASMQSPVARQSQRRTWLALGSVIFVAIVAAAAFIGFNGSGALSPKHDLSGTFSLTDSSKNFSAAFCVGSGGYSDIRSGTNVVLKDGDGKLLATGSLGDSTGIGDTCTFIYSLKDVPERPFYTIEVGSRGDLSYSLEEMRNMGWSIALTLGS